MTRFLLLLAIVLALCSCQYTNCTFTAVSLTSGGQIKADIRQVPVDKSTQGAISANQTVTPQTTVTAIPGM